MAQAATISGVVSSVGTSQPLAAATVTAGQRTCLPGLGCFFSSSGSAQTLADGSYTISGLDPATYVVVAIASEHVSATYPDDRCYQWPIAQCGAGGTPSVSLADAGSSASGIDFSLHPGGSIAGRVTAAATSLPLAAAVVTLQLFDGSNQPRGLVTVETDAQGDFRFERLRDAQFTLIARGPDDSDYLGSIYPSTTCDDFSVPCVTTQADAQTIGVSQALLGRDLSLLVGGRVRVQLSDALTGAPISQQVRMRLASSPAVFASANSPAATPGRYDFPPIAPTNVLLTFAYLGSPDYGNELYDEVPCLNDACDFSAGTSIAVAAGAVVQIQETLDPLRIARGRVVDRSGVPLPDVEVGAGTAGSGGLVAHFAATFQSAIADIQDCSTAVTRFVAALVAAPAHHGVGSIGRISKRANSRDCIARMFRSLVLILASLPT